LRARTKQLSLYLEEPVYEELRNLAFSERVKMHQLIVEGVDLMLRKRGHPSIKDLMKKANQPGH
jgi:predicted DNA-binding ribbon-helix-helix protein